MRYHEIIHENAQGMSRLGNVSYDQVDGIGSVPLNAEVNYEGFAVKMTARQFASLTPHRDFDFSSLDYLIKALKAGKPIGSPFLICDFSGPVVRVTGHEGRTRCRAIETAFGSSTEILVHIFVRGIRRKDLTSEMVSNFQSKAIPEWSRDFAQSGPYFENEIWFRGAWTTIASLPSAQPTETV